MSVFNVHHAKTHLPRLLERVEAGESVTIARAGKHVAVLLPHRTSELVFGTAKGIIWYDDESFDDPDPEIIATFDV